MQVTGLGQASTLKAAKEGANLSLVELNTTTKSKIQSVAPNTAVLNITADVSDEKTEEKYVNETVKYFGRIDSFCNNAG